MLSFFADIVFQMLSTVLEDEYNYLHIHRWEIWSVKRFAGSVQSLSQHFNPYLSDSKCSTSQCSTMSIVISAFRKTPDDILGYCQKFFFEVCTQSLDWCNNILLVIGQSSFYISLGGNSLCPDSLWRRQKMCLPFPQIGLEWSKFWSGLQIGPALVPGHVSWSSLRKKASTYYGLWSTVENTSPSTCFNL